MEFNSGFKGLKIVLSGRAREEVLSEIGHEATPSASRFGLRFHSSRAMFLNRRAADRYRVLASIIPGRERFSWNLSF